MKVWKMGDMGDGQRQLYLKMDLDATSHNSTNYSCTRCWCLFWERVTALYCAYSLATCVMTVFSLNRLTYMEVNCRYQQIGGTILNGLCNGYESIALYRIATSVL
jgi:hypothetical protein